MKRPSIPSAAKHAFARDIYHDRFEASIPAHDIVDGLYDERFSLGLGTWYHMKLSMVFMMKGLVLV